VIVKHVVIVGSSLALGGLVAFSVASQQATATPAQSAPLDLPSLFSYLAISKADHDLNPAKADSLRNVAIFGLGAGAVASVALFALLEGVTR
jgi:hypothetical protein